MVPGASTLLLSPCLTREHHAISCRSHNTLHVTVFSLPRTDLRAPGSRLSRGRLSLSLRRSTSRHHPPVCCLLARPRGRRGCLTIRATFWTRSEGLTVLLTSLPVEEQLEVLQLVSGVDLGKLPVTGVSAQGSGEAVCPVPGEAGVGGRQPEQDPVHTYHQTLTLTILQAARGGGHSGAGGGGGGCGAGRTRRPSRSSKRRTEVGRGAGVKLYTGTVGAGGQWGGTVVVVPAVRQERGKERGQEVT